MSRLFASLVICLAALMPVAARAAATAWVGNAHAAARLITAEAAAGSAATLDAGLEIRLAPGWHAYWRTPGDAGVPPSVDWKGSENLARAEIAWPAPRRLVVDGLQNAIYTGDVVLPLSLTLAHPGQPVSLHASVDYAACADICVPYHADLSLMLPAGLAAPSPEAPLIAAARARVPGGLAEAGLRLISAVVARAPKGAALAVTLRGGAMPFTGAPDLFVEGIDALSPGAPALRLDGRSARFVVALPGQDAAKLAGRPLAFTLVDGARTATFGASPALGALPRPDAALPAILLVALLGGLILNVMPCVLPVLSLKLLALAGHAGAERRRVRAGLLATAAGVLASFLAIAAALAGLKATGAAAGWGIQFQQPWFLAAMAALCTLFAASLWDWLPVGLPGLSGVARVQSRRPLLDSFLTGAFATLLASSCSAPFLGTAIGFALPRGAADIAAVFAALGLGMGAPYLLAAAFPGFARLLPRPGRWMLWLRAALGLLLAATALWLLSVLALVAGPRAAALAAAALALLLAVLFWRSRGGLARRALGPAAAMLAALAVLAPALSAPPGQLAPERGPALWRPFDAGSIAAAVAGGKVVFVDVTAAWCLTCKVNALAVLDRDPVAARLRAPGVVALRADWTRPDPAITAYLQRFGRYGVPMDVIYGPALPDGIALPELLTPAAVTGAMRRALGRGTERQATLTPALSLRERPAPSPSQRGPG